MAECGLCRDCKWWTPEHRQDWAEQHFPGLCCRCEEGDTKFYPCGWDIEGVETMPDFGCVQWEQRG